MRLTLSQELSTVTRRITLANAHGPGNRSTPPEKVGPQNTNLVVGVHVRTPNRALHIAPVRGYRPFRIIGKCLPRPLIKAQ